MLVSWQVKFLRRVWHSKVHNTGEDLCQQRDVGRRPVLMRFHNNASVSYVPLTSQFTSMRHVFLHAVQSLYGIPATLATQASNKLGVSGFIDQFAQTADLQVHQLPNHA